MYSASIENNKDEYPIFKKVKLGDCYKYDGAIAYRFILALMRRHLIIISFQKSAKTLIICT